MRKYIIFLLFALIPMFTSAKSVEWVEVQSIIVPLNTPIYYRFTEKGNIQYFLKLDKIGNVTVSKSNAEKFLGGEIQLELVKWQSKIDMNKFKYTVRQYKPAQSNFDLRDIFGKVETDNAGRPMYYDTAPHNEFPGKRYSLLIK